MITTAKITKKGQVTIPQKIRKQLQSDVIEFTVEGDTILIRPVKSVAASLSSYGGKNTLPFEKAREKAWEEAAKERHGEKHPRR